MNDAQFTMAKTYRPFVGFEKVYQNLAGTIPLAIPGVRDSNAGKPGYVANLMQGIGVVLGARVFVQIPMIIDQYASQPNYAYVFQWRMRNQQAFTDSIKAQGPGVPYHLPTFSPGRVETVAPGGDNSELLFVPGASQVEIFEQAEPGGSGAASANVRQQTFIPVMGDSWVQPVLADGSKGEWQQGVYQFSSNVNCSGPTFFPLNLEAAGDELLILIYKTNTGVAWDFGGVDKGVSNTYGTNNGGLPNNPNIGILIQTGKNA